MIPSLDGFRAYGVLAIVLYHAVLFSGIFLTQAGTRLGEGLTFLGLGVDALFIVSGFVVFLPTVASGGDFGSIGSFAIRRAARLVPAYLLVLAITLLLIAVAPPHDPSNQTLGPLIGFPSVGAILAHATFLQTPLIVAGVPLGFGLDGPVWTLSVEIAFYLVLPFIASAYFRHPWRGLLIAAAISLAWHLAFANFDTFSPLLGDRHGSTTEITWTLASDYQLPAWAFSFAAGMTAAWLYVRLHRLGKPELLRRRASLLQPLALLALILCAHLSYESGIADAFGREATTTAGIGRRAPLASMGFSLSLAILILSTAFASSAQQFLWSNRLIRWIADVSYGIYLIHFLVMAYLLIVVSPPRPGTFADFLLWAASAIAIASVYAYVTARFLERPIRKWAHQYGRSARGIPEGPPKPVAAVADGDR